MVRHGKHEEASLAADHEELIRESRDVHPLDLKRDRNLSCRGERRILSS